MSSTDSQIKEGLVLPLNTNELVWFLAVIFEVPINDNCKVASCEDT